MIKKSVNVKNVKIGGGAPISIQSMCSVPFSRLDELKKQAIELQSAGCDILRVAVPDMESVRSFSKLKEALKIPLVADIHFDYKLALESIEAGADKIRINPGNIGSEHIKAVAHAAKNKNIPIRVGINSGSLEKEILTKHQAPTSRALAESAFKNVDILTSCDFDDIVVSIKASDVRTMVESYRIFDAEKRYPYPLHLGVTEAGTMHTGLIKSSVGIGSLLLDGIGDTIRISLTADPIEEIKAAKTLLRALGLRKSGIEVISCPTCGRSTVDTIRLAEYIEKEFSYIIKPIKIAVMGCVVNGPGEAREADLGVTGANGEYIVFKNNKVIHRVSEENILKVIKDELDKIENEY